MNTAMIKSEFNRVVSNSRRFHTKSTMTRFKALFALTTSFPLLAVLLLAASGSAYASGLADRAPAP